MLSINVSKIRFQLMHESLLSPSQHSSIIFLAWYCYCPKAVTKFQRCPYQYKQRGYSAHKRTGSTNTTMSLLRNKSTKKSSNVWINLQSAVPWNLWTCAGGPNCLLHFRSLKTSILEEWKQKQAQQCLDMKCTTLDMDRVASREYLNLAFKRYLNLAFSKPALLSK